MTSPRKHILIADSDEQSLIELERLLQDQGFETTTAWSTSETFDLLARNSFDLLLVADHPPELNCEQVLRRRHTSAPQVPLVVLQTSPRHPFIEPYLVSLGAGGFVQKWRKADVTKMVQGMLGGSVAKSAVAGTMNLG